jgi:PAS domain S-box-containing protein
LTDRRTVHVADLDLFGLSGTEMLDHFLTRAGVAVWAADDEDHGFAIRYWNRGAEAIYGYLADRVLGRSYIDLFVSDEERDRAIRDHRHVLEHPTLSTFWQRTANDVTSEGRVLPVLYSTFAMYAPPLERYLLVEVDVDITKSVFDAVTATTPDDKAVVTSSAELEAIENQAVADTYGVIVPLLLHRAGSAVDAIVTEVEMITAQEPEGEGGADVRMRRIKGRATDLGNLLDELCDLSLAQPPRSKVNVLDLALSTRLAWFKAELRNVEVSFEIDPGLVCTTHDVLLREALGLIITNACEAVLRTPVKGGMAVAGDVVVSAVADPEAARILIHVDDNGPGLPEGTFVTRRVRPTLKERKHGHGHGHGLMYAERALERVGGELVLSGEPSPLGGARVTIALGNQPPS